MLIPSLPSCVLFLLLGVFFLSLEEAFEVLRKLIIPYPIDNEEINIEFLLKNPLSVPDAVPVESRMLEIEERATLIP